MKSRLDSLESKICTQENIITLLEEQIIFLERVLKEHLRQFHQDASCKEKQELWNESLRILGIRD